MIYKFKVDKLIRDNIPNMLSKKRIRFNLKTLDKNEYIEHLNHKLLEEVTEVLNSKNKEECIEELADVLEVFLALCDFHDFSLQDIEKKRIEKKIEHGGFEQRIYNAYVEIKEDNPNIEYYMNRPLQYPQIMENH